MEDRRFDPLKRTLLAPLDGPVRDWALGGRPTRLKELALRYIVVSGFGARGVDFRRVLEDGLEFHGNSRDLLPLYVDIFGVWEPPLTAFISRRLSTGDVFVDVGAHVGWFTMKASRLVGPEGRVIAIEASPRTFQKLVHHVDLNQLENVETLNLAVASEPGWLDVADAHAGQTGMTHTGAVRPEAFPGAIQARTLDSIVGEDAARVRIVKMDIEGAEFDVCPRLGPLLDRLPGGAEIVVEVGAERATSPDDVRRLFEPFTSRGFEAYELHNAYDVASYRRGTFPELLPRMPAPPAKQTDVVFSRLGDTDGLVL